MSGHQRAVGLYDTKDSLNIGMLAEGMQKPAQGSTMDIRPSASCNAQLERREFARCQDGSWFNASLMVESERPLAPES